MRLRIGHSPDPDDAFMAWALAEGIVRDPAFEPEVLARDIETLNQWALDGKGLDITAMSLATFAQVTDEYQLLPFGGSFGEGYGPVVVAAQPLEPADLPHLHVAHPGVNTTATSALRMALGSFENLEAVHFADILSGVKHGLYDAGLVIHEGQITYEREGLMKVFDVAEWWRSVEPGLPLPLGVMAVRRDVGEDLLPRAVALVKRALDAALADRPAALQYASKFARGLGMADVERFVDMYVSTLTRDMRPQGARAVERFIARMVDAKLVEGGARFEFAPDPRPPNPALLALAEPPAAAGKRASRKAPKEAAKVAPKAKSAKRADAKKAAPKAAKKPAKRVAKAKAVKRPAKAKPARKAAKKAPAKRKR